jgi:hypothetical protein
MILRVVLLVCSVALASCTSLQPPQEPAPVENRDVPPAPPPVLPPPSSRPLPPPETPSVEPVEPETAPPPPRAATPSSTLLASVDAAMAAGQLEQAAALCERALRISPRDGHVWYRLATIRYQQARFTDAAGLARRAMSFAGPDAKLAQDSQRLLQQAESRN